jgi:hypothetical protein
MSSSQSLFLSDDNISLLWEVLIDESFIKINDMETRRSLFNKTINDFYSQYNDCPDLMLLNKEFLKIFISILSNSSGQFNEDPPSQKNMSDFESRLAQVQNDFNKFNSRPQPLAQDFTIKLEEKPVSLNEIDQISANRSYDAPNNINLQNQFENNSSEGGTTKLSDLH